MNEIQPQLVGMSREGDTGLRLRSPARGDDEDEVEVEYEGCAQDVPTQDEKKWSVALAFMSVADVVISGIIMGVSFHYAYRDNGVSLYCLGFQSTSHVISSLLLALRFVSESSLPQTSTSSASEGLIRRRRRRHLGREQCFSVIMGIVMLISACALLFKAFRKIRFWDKWYQDHNSMDQEVEWVQEFLAWYGFSVYLLQAIFRGVAGCKLRRSIIWHAFVASVVSLVFLFVIGLASSYEKEWSWKVEPIAAIALSFVSLGEGIRIVIMHLDDMDTRLRHDPRA